MTRFFIPAAQIRGNQVSLEGADHHHLLNVLRKNIGDEIQVLNGKGEEFNARICEIRAESTIAELCGSTGRQTEPRLKINLIQSLPKADKFEWIIQKNTELGVSSFQPVISERSVVKLDAGAKIKKQERWQKIIKEAAEQSGRGIIPQLKPVLEWRQLETNFPPGLVLIPWEDEQIRSLKAVLGEVRELPEQLSIVIGPEGGFARTEVERMAALGAITVTLGPRILRTETAGLVAASASLYHFGELD
ncbi:MAG TPA: 16S rRNA (uracil(1498)-N(3))-methyltransferase [Bacillota bacterium]|nr:16S rRNA (uracil(1498)-N(3))-methyltransferase [Bacillota bacterium]